MVMAATSVIHGVLSTTIRRDFETKRPKICLPSLTHNNYSLLSTLSFSPQIPAVSSSQSRNGFQLAACFPVPPPSSPKSTFSSSTKLYVSGLSFRTTKESLRNAFENFGQLVEVYLVMDRIANRPRGFAFLRYATEEESKKAIEGMHGKFLDGRVIFVEVAKPRSALRQGPKQNSRQC